MATETADAYTVNLAQTHTTKQFLAHIKIDNDDPRIWVGGGARLWVIDDDGETVLDLALGSDPRCEAVAQLLAVGYTIVEAVTPTLLVIQKR